MRVSLLKNLILLTTVLGFKQACAQQFDLVTSKTKVSIYYDAKECKLDSISANLLAGDIERVTGYRPSVGSDLSKASGNVIIIGSVNAALIKGLKEPAVTTGLEHQWERYRLKLVNLPGRNINKALVITGSDFRGTAYGVFDISNRIGVTPWYWWADATVAKKTSLTINIPDFTSASPSVKYRGIFINDEDWGLQPWAAKTLEPETGDIGPKTYAKVFELLLRLKANLIWPAMHPSTKAFYHYPGNVKVAGDYQIVVGSSHAEPMLRNNVGEWSEKTMGPFNYLTNQQKVAAYWEERVKESSHFNGIYTIGMRGVHDSGIEGVKTVSETVPLLERIFKDQREMLKKYVNPDITKVPQVFTPYKEVLDVYDGGLKVPEDVTLVWPDDNYGYIQRLDDEQESRRPGGSGVYYHVSYWGRPHDYIWLCTTSPGLIREEMTKAYDMDDHNLWVVNVGDIKPAEYDIQFFLDMAYAIKPFYNQAYLHQHLKQWISNNIDSEHANEIASVMNRYYELAFERKPEFMGWSQTEPNTPVHFTAYNHQYYGDQAQQRVNAYERLEHEVKSLRTKLGNNNQSSFYELVYYPVVSSSLMNKKFLYRDKAHLYAQQGRLMATHYDSLSNAAYQGIIRETNYYNTELANGKWAHIMSMNPRNLAVFRAPDIKIELAKRPDTWAALPEGADSSAVSLKLPDFSPAGQWHFIDIFLTKPGIVDYKVSTSAPWIRTSAISGKLTAENGGSQKRLWVDIDWTKVPAKGAEGTVTISGSDKNITVAVRVNNESLKGFTGFVEANGYVSMYAKNFHTSAGSGQNQWIKVSGLGATEASMEAMPLRIAPTGKTDLSDEAIKHNASLSYEFYTFNAAPAEVKVYTLPTYPLNRSFEMRYAVSVDNGQATVLNFKTFGRSTEWKQGVLSNSAVRSVKIPTLSAGKHTLHIYMIDPGVIVNRAVIDLGGLKPFYGLLPETKIRSEAKPLSH